MNKKLIRLTESDLRKIVKESVKAVVNEGIDLRNQYVEIMNKLYDLEKLLAPLSKYDDKLWRPFRQLYNAFENYIRENPASTNPMR